MAHLELDAECDANLTYNPNICRVDDLGNPMRPAKKAVAAGGFTASLASAFKRNLVARTAPGDGQGQPHPRCRCRPRCH
jgi:hypothetical protein